MVKYIFSINTGRSGSTYVASLLKGFEDVEAFHENKPECYGVDMSNYINNKASNIKALSDEKLEVINKIIDNSNKVYAETSHYFIKGFGWEFLKQLNQKDVGVILIYRSPEKIAKSWIQKGTSILGRGGRNFLLLPVKNSSININNYINGFAWKYVLMKLYYRFVNIPYLLCLDKNRRVTKLIYDFEFNYNLYYVAEIQRLEKEFLEKYPDVVTCSLDLENTSQEEKINTLKSCFNLGEFNADLTTIRRNSSKSIR